MIPARGGSKGVPGKNLAPVAGVSLLGRAIQACRAAGNVDLVLVSTDDPAIAAEGERHGATVIRRPADLAGDTASSESAVLHALDQLDADPEVTLLVQCTSPFLRASDVAAAVERVITGAADAAFTAAPFHGFVWRTNDGIARGINHEEAGRLRRQERDPEFLEDGAVYAMRTRGLRDGGHRFFGRISLVPTDPDRVLEIDEPGDLDRARALSPLLDVPRVPQRSDVDAVVLDFDGTQTDDRVWITAEGDERVQVHRGDGLGVAALRRAGLPVLILSSEVNPVVRRRATKLGVPVIHGVTDKAAALADWCSGENLDPSRVLYLGNDANDIGCFRTVGWPIAVASAHPDVQQHVRLTTAAAGGRGAVREIASWILGKDLG